MLTIILLFSQNVICLRLDCLTRDLVWEGVCFGHFAMFIVLFFYKWNKTQYGFVRLTKKPVRIWKKRLNLGMRVEISCVSSDMMSSSVSIEVILPRKAFRTEITHVSLSLVGMNWHVSLHISLLRKCFETDWTLISTPTYQIICDRVWVRGWGMTVTMIVSRERMMRMKRVMGVKTFQWKTVDNLTNSWSWDWRGTKGTNFAWSKKHMVSQTIPFLVSLRVIKADNFTTEGGVGGLCSCMQ